jgi:branched-chain amino acid transport system substrate-binding protein
MAGVGSEGFYITNIVINKKSEFYKTYRDLFYNKFGKEPSAYDAYAYEGAKIILAALKGAGNKAEDIKNYLHSNTFPSMTGDLTFDEKGQVKRLWGVYQVINGKFVELD